jgi:hypothetical protein
MCVSLSTSGQNATSPGDMAIGFTPKADNRNHAASGSTVNRDEHESAPFRPLQLS